MPLDLNILIRGQSNAAYFSNYHAGDVLAHAVSDLLGFDGRTATVTVLGGPGSTEQTSTALVWDQNGVRAWMRRLPGQGWAANPLEARLLAYLSSLPASLRAAPTLTLWMHNETDSNNPAITRALWADALRADAGWVRAALGQGPATTPYLFAWIPFDISGGGPWLADEDRQGQAMRLAMADLVADQSFHAVAAPQTGDLDMNGWGGRLGGMHVSVTDAMVLARRLARPIACAFLPYARPSAPVTTLACDPAVAGPQALRARLLPRGGVLVDVALAGRTALAPFGAAARQGAGWQARLSDGRLVSAEGARPTGPATVALTFAADLPAGAVLYYGYGHGRISGADGKGAGAAIYDMDGLALVGPPQGLRIGDAA